MGYGYMNMPDARRKEGAHRLSYMYWKKMIPKGMLVCHTCDVRRCVNPDHLFLGTHKENTQDMWKKGRENRNPKSKLSDADVLTIRAEYKGWRSAVELGERFGIHPQYAYGIALRKYRKAV